MWGVSHREGDKHARQGTEQGIVGEVVGLAGQVYFVDQGQYGLVECNCLSGDDDG